MCKVESLTSDYYFLCNVMALKYHRKKKSITLAHLVESNE